MRYCTKNQYKTQNLTLSIMLQSFVPLAAIKGRGAASSIAHRFAVDARKAFDNSWLASLSHEEGAVMFFNFEKNLRAFRPQQAEK